MTESNLVPLYYVLGPKGFWSRGGSFTSEVQSAKTFQWQESIEFCKRRLGSEPGLACYPVPQAAILAVHKK